MVSIKKVDYRRRNPERKLFFGFPAIPFAVFLTFVAFLLLFNLVSTNSTNSTLGGLTGNVIDTVSIQNSEMAYIPGAPLQGDFALQFQRDDLIPENAYIEVSLSSPQCPLYYICSDGTRIPWKLYDQEKQTCYDNETMPWLLCPEGTIESVSDYNGPSQHVCGNDIYFKIGTCCGANQLGQGNYYDSDNLKCDFGNCYDGCGAKKTFTLQQYILVYNKENDHSEYPYLGNYKNGTYMNAGTKIIGLANESGYGFSYCPPIITPKPKVYTTDAIAPITGKVPELVAGVDLSPILVVSNRNPVVITVKNLRGTTSLATTAKLEITINSNLPCSGTVSTKAIAPITGNYLCLNTIATVDVPAIIGGQSVNITLPTLSLYEGQQATFTVNPDRTAPETYLTSTFYDNNNISLTFTTIPITDLNVTSADYNYDLNSLDVKIGNLGESVLAQVNTQIYVRIWEGSTLLATQAVSGLNYGETKTVTFAQNLVNKNIIVGVSSSVLEGDYSNNNLTKYIGAASIPADLILSELSYDSQAQRLQGKITNVGGETAGASRITVCVISTTEPSFSSNAVVGVETCTIISTKDVISLTPSQSTSLILYNGIDREYEGKTVRIKVDYDNSISEGTVGELNNVNETYLTPISDLPNLQVSDIQYQCGSAYPTSPRIAVVFNNSDKADVISTSDNLILLSIYNCSSIPASASTSIITAKVGDTSIPPTCQLITYRVINSISAGETKIEVFAASQMLGLNIKAVIDSGNVIQESNETDNSRYLALPKVDFEINNLVYSGSLISGTGMLWFNITNKGTTASAPQLTIYRCSLLLPPPIKPPISIKAIAPITGLQVATEVCYALTGYENLQLSQINAGGSILFNLANPEGTKGTWLRILVDPQEQICEPDEANNQESWSYWTSLESCGGTGANFSLEEPDSCTDGITGTTNYDICINNDLLNEWSCGNGIECKNITYSCSAEGYQNCTVDRCVPIPVTTCIDTDIDSLNPEGRNYYVQGTCTGEDGIGHTDTCNDLGGLTEYYCAGTECQNTTVTIPNSELSCYSCSVGVCISNPFACGTWSNVYDLDFGEITGNGLLNLDYLTAPTISNNSYYILTMKLKGISGIPCLNGDCDPTIAESNQTFRVIKPSSVQQLICKGEGRCESSLCTPSATNDCADECTIDGQCTSSGGGGGGGGGGSTLCLEDWQCSVWGVCSIDGSRTRSCSRCGTTSIESEVCVYQCIPNWDCSEWSYCDENGEQSQVCTDKNRCVQTNYEYVQKRDCCAENWDCDWGKCSNQKQEKVCVDSNKCGTTFLQPASETRECASGFLDNVPLGAKIAVPVVIVGGVLASLFLLRRKSVGSIGKITKTQSAPSQQTKNADDKYPELGHYIKNSRAGGMKDSDIKSKLLDAGWPKDIVDKAFK